MKRLITGSARSGARCATICSAASRSAGTLEFSAAAMAFSTSSPPNPSSALSAALRTASDMASLRTVPTSVGDADFTLSAPTASMAASCTGSGMPAASKRATSGSSAFTASVASRGFMGLKIPTTRSRCGTSPQSASCFSASARISAVALSLSE